MKLKLLVLAFASCLLFTSCTDIRGVGVGRWPFIPVAKIAFDDAEKAQLQQIAKDYPALFAKLQNHNNTNADLIREYNGHALRINTEQLKVMGWSDNEISAMRKTWIQTYGLEPDKEK